MNLSIPSLLLGGAGVGVLYFLYLSATKGLPAAWSWLKSKLAAGSAELSKVRSDLAQLEQGAVAHVKARATALESDVSALKKSAAPAPVASASSAQ
jgi:hypothetical protein